MLSLILNSPQIALFVIVGLLTAIAFHEAAHAYVADRLGDLTPRHLGRLTLDPRAHLDPMGTIFLLLAGFGWGKPVPFNPISFKNPALGSTLVALSGPGTNFLLAAAFAILIRFSVPPVDLWSVMVDLNILLGLFNLIPLAPLDGEKVVGGLIPPSFRPTWDSIQSFSIYLLLGILFLSYLGRGFFLGPAVSLIYNLLTGQSSSLL